MTALQAQFDRAGAAGDYGVASELRYGKLAEAEQQLAGYVAQAEATPAGRALLAVLREGDRAAQARAQEFQARAQAAEQLAQTQRAAQAERTKEAEREAAAAAPAILYRATEMAVLEAARREQAPKRVVRIRVTEDETVHISKFVGALAVRDEAPGADGLIGMNLSYNPGAAVWRISGAVGRAREHNGEVFEDPTDRTSRERATQAEVSNARYQQQQSKNADLSTDKGGPEL